MSVVNLQHANSVVSVREASDHLSQCKPERTNSSRPVHKFNALLFLYTESVRSSRTEPYRSAASGVFLVLSSVVHLAIVLIAIVVHVYFVFKVVLTRRTSHVRTNRVSN